MLFRCLCDWRVLIALIPLDLQFFERFHQLFVQVASNPFYTVGTPIDSARLKVEVARLVTMSA